MDPIYRPPVWPVLVAHWNVPCFSFPACDLTHRTDIHHLAHAASTHLVASLLRSFVRHHWQRSMRMNENIYAYIDAPWLKNPDKQGTIIWVLTVPAFFYKALPTHSSLGVTQTYSEIFLFTETEFSLTRYTHIWIGLRYRSRDAGIGHFVFSSQGGGGCWVFVWDWS